MSKLLKAAATACVIGLGTIASASAHADRGHFGPHGGIYFRGPAFAPFYYPFYATPFYPYAADVYAQSAWPPLFIDGGVATSQSAPIPAN